MNYSVALCTYNGERFLAEQLQSIINQTKPPKQIVICDDVSTDGTNRIIEGFVRDCPEIQWKHVINDQNIGVVRNFEKAIGLCDEEIIFLSDQDDVWLEYKAEVILKQFKEKPHLIYFTNALMVNEFGESMDMSLFQAVNFLEPQQRLFEKKMDRFQFLSKNFATGATIVFKKSEVNPMLPMPITNYFIHDGWIVSMGICRGTVGFIDEPLLKYRIHESQTAGIKIKHKEINHRNDINLTNILSYKSKKEGVLLSYLLNDRKLVSGYTLRILLKRKYLYDKILRRPNSVVMRFTKINFAYYKYRIPEFHTIRLFFGNFFHYLFDK